MDVTQFHQSLTSLIFIKLTWGWGNCSSVHSVNLGSSSGTISQVVPPSVKIQIRNRKTMTWKFHLTKNSPTLGLSGTFLQVPSGAI